MPVKKILILYTSHSQGHQKLAENIGTQLRGAGYEVRLSDILKVQAGFLVSTTRSLHSFVNRYLPFIWRWLYLSPSFTNFTLAGRLKIAKKNYKQTLGLVNDYKPDVIITTQTTASAVVAALKEQKMFNGKFGIAFSDFHLHKYWLYDQADFYLANIEEQKREMVSLGIPAEKIFICGVMLAPQSPINKSEIRNKLGIMENEKVVLMASGTFGWGLDEQLILRLSKNPNTRVIVATGKNNNNYNHLKQKFAATNVIILAFYSPFEELCAIADVFITKPGGLSITEALRQSLPIAVLYMLPGQEELNYRYLKSQNLLLCGPENLVEKVIAELSTEAFRQSLRQNLNSTKVLPKPEVLLSVID